MSGMLGSTVGKVMWMRRAGILTFALAMVAMVLAAGVLALVGTAKPAEAAFPGINGKITFSSSRTTGAGVNNPEGDSEIFTMNPDGRGIEQITLNDANDYDPAFNHNGNKIVFTSQRDNQNEEIYVMDADGQNQTRLTTNTASDNSPAFNHDGSKIVFTSNRGSGGNTDIWAMDPVDVINNTTGDPGPDGNGDNLIRLTTNTAFDSNPAWSPGGSNKIAFMSTRDHISGEIYVMDAAPESATNQPLRLTNNAVSDFGPNWSPDGTKIAFTRDANPDPGVTNNDIFVMNAMNGSEQKRLTKKAAFDAFPAWSPDGRKLAFRSERGGAAAGEVYVMKARPESIKNRPKNLTKNDAFDSEPEWQPIPQP